MLKEAIKILENTPYLTAFAPHRFIFTIIDRSWKVAWTLQTMDYPIQAIGGGSLLNQDIREFYDITDTSLFSDPGDLKTIQDIENTIKTKGPRRFDFPLKGMKTYASKNKFETSHTQFTLAVPVSHIRFLKILPDFFLGIINLNNRIVNLFRWPKEINVLLDSENRIIGFNSRFKQLINTETELLNRNAGDFIQTDFLEPALAQARPDAKRGKVLFEYSPTRPTALEVHPEESFVFRKQGIVCDTLRSVKSAFIRIPVKPDFSRYNYLFEIESQDNRNEPPFCILNGGDISGATYPDSNGILFGAAPAAGRKAPSGQFRFMVKNAGDIVRHFTQFQLGRDQAEKRITYTILKQTHETAFHVNRRPVGWYPNGDMPAALPHTGHLIIGLRPNTACVIKKIILKQFEKTEVKKRSHEYVTFFLNSPEKIYKVVSYYFLYENEILHYLYLEDLDAMEQIRRLINEKRKTQQQIRRLKKELTVRRGMDRVVGSSPEFIKIKETLMTVAKSTAPILITGETGTGKSLLAQVVHEISDRANGPFVKVDCSNIPETLIESELFGHEKGAFTGAQDTYQGKFEQADGGTLFLDEIGNISMPVQAKLLNVLQEFSLQRIGGTKSIPVDIRVISATNTDLEERVRQGTFRKDLFYRLHVFRINVPSLYERIDDIPLLCEHFFNTDLKNHYHTVTAISPDVYKQLMDYTWPGNVRELYNVLLKSVILCSERTLRSAHLVMPVPVKKTVDDRKIQEPLARQSGRRTRITLERIMDEVRACEGNISWAADNLGIARFTIYNRLERAGIALDSLRRG